MPEKKAKILLIGHSDYSPMLLDILRQTSSEGIGPSLPQNETEKKQDAPTNMGLNPYWPESYMPSVFMLTRALCAEDWDKIPSPPPKPLKPLKKCIRCGKEHRHNNAFCSAECCKADREENK